jgi:hypothetical protein
MARVPKIRMGPAQQISKAGHVSPPRGSKTVVLPWVWTYLYKIDPVTLEDTAKSHGTCNGGSRHSKVVTLAKT